MKIFPLILSVSLALAARAEMVRVIEVQDGRTLVIARNGAREVIRLAGIAVTDELHARQLLRWTAGTSWVLIEKHASGDHLVWRSPDALLLNRELVVRGYARATLHGIEPEPNVIVTYLGQVNPAGPAPTPGRRIGSDTSRRSTATPSRKTRPPRSPKARTGRASASTPAAPGS